MGAPSKRAKKTRVASDFDLIRLSAELRHPKVSTGLYAWDLDSIRRARDDQMRGHFEWPARLAEAMRTDYALFSSFLNRLAPQRGLPIALKPPNDSARAARVLAEAEALFGKKGVGIHRDTLTDIDGTLANHGVAFAVNVVTPRDDGSRIDFELRAWPIEFVRWDPTARAFKTRVEGGGEETICHGDGRWIVFKEHEIEPWKHGAILAAGMVWADHAVGVRDRSHAGTVRGNGKFVGTLPEGIALQDSDGKLTPEAAAFVQLMRDLADVASPVGVKPFGAMLDLIVDTSQGWQIFKEIIAGGDNAADKIYLGRDATAASAGGDGVKFLFGVRDDLVEGTCNTIADCLGTGTIEPWAALNYGDSSLAPTREYLLPDADQDARLKSLAERTKAFYEAIDAARKATFFEIDQSYVDALAKDYDVTPPKLKTLIPPATAGVPPSNQTVPPGAPAPVAPPKLAAVP